MTARMVVDELVEALEWLLALLVGPESSLYGGYDLQEGDRDAVAGVAARYGGVDLPAGAPAATHVRDLHRDLRELGIMHVRDDQTTFDRHTRWAVMDFQAYANMTQVASERLPGAAETFAAAGVADGQLRVLSPTGFPDQTPFRVRVQNEVLEVTAVTADPDPQVDPVTGTTTATATLTVTRAAEGTAAAAHPAGSAVTLTRWAARLDPQSVRFYERYGGRVTGVANAGTRAAIERWKRDRWRCPVVVEACELRAGQPSRIYTIPAAQGGPRPADNLWRHDEVRVSDVGGVRVFVRDFSEHYQRPDNRPPDGPAEDQMTVLGGYTTFDDQFFTQNNDQAGHWNGPLADALRPHPWSPEAEMLPEHLLGATLAELAAELDPADPASGRRLSTYKVVRAVADVEAQGYFDGVNAYDNAFASLGPCHWTAGNRVYQQPAPNRPPRERWDTEAGELWAFLAWLAERDEDAFEQAVGHFGIGVTPAWGADGRLLYQAGLRKYQGRATLQREAGAPGELLGGRGCTAA